MDKVYKPNISEDLAKEIVLRLYGLQVTSIRRFVSFDGQNFYIKVSKEHGNFHIKHISEDGYVLKITNTWKTSVSGHFSIMHAAMVHLSEKGLLAPLPIQSLKHNTWNSEVLPLRNAEDLIEPLPCGIHLLSHVPGSTILTVECTKNILYQWGHLLAKCQNAMEDFSAPNLDRRLVFWSLEHIPEIENYMNCLDEDRKELVKSVLNRYPEIESNLSKLPKGVIHGDFNESNVLVQKKTLESGKSIFTVGGILDFEDLHIGTYVWDVSVMLAYTLLAYDDDDVLDGPRHALAGYLSLRSLNSLELSLLKVCLECRLIQSLVLCAYSYSKDTNNSYLLTSSKTGWSKLRQINSVRNYDLLQKWKNIELSYTS